MLYLGIDQQARQLTVSLRNQTGDVLLARQVSTEPDRVHAYFAQLSRDGCGMGNPSWQFWRFAASTTG
jgi:transposase